MSTQIYQDRRTGQRVKQIGATNTKEDTVLVSGNDNIPYHAYLAQLIPCDAEGTPDFDHKHEALELAEEEIPTPTIDVVETRLNVNMASAEEIAKRVPGVGYRIAKKVKELQLTQPGERYRTLEQLRSASNRVNWDEIFRLNLLFIG